jgi:hypothetical protein
MRSAIFPGWLLFFAALLGPCCVLAAAPAAPPPPAGPPISLELNKLAPLEGGTGCRVYLVLANPGKEPVPELQLDLVLFGTDGIIAERVAVEVGPLLADKTDVRLFDLAGTKCGSIGHILLNDVLSCQVGGTAPAAGGDAAADQREACLERIAVSSLAAVPLTK